MITSSRPVVWLERLALALASLVLLAEGAAIALVAATGLPIGSGVPEVAVTSALETSDWLDARRRAGRSTATRVGITRSAGDDGLPGQPADPRDPGASRDPREAFVRDGEVPPDERFDGRPWLRRIPGVSYAPVRAVPDVLHRKYRSLEEALNLAHEGGGERVDGPYGPAWRVRWLDESSVLATRVGLLPGDVLVSINGLPVDGGSGGVALFEALRDERRIAVLVLRDGRPLVLSFEVR